MYKYLLLVVGGKNRGQESDLIYITVEGFAYNVYLLRSANSNYDVRCQFLTSPSQKPSTSLAEMCLTCEISASLNSWQSSLFQLSNS